MEKIEEFEKYPCVHRDEDGCCGTCAYLCECWWPEKCNDREE